MSKRLPCSYCVYLAALLLFCSCTKSKVSNPTTVINTYLKFTADGYTYQWDGVPGDGNTCYFCGSDLTKTNGNYILRSSDPKNYSNGISLKIQATSLSATSYTLTTTNATSNTNADHKLTIYRSFQVGSSSPRFLMAAATETGDFATITISRIHDSIYADGTFTARITLSPYGPTASKLDITSGEFRNLKIIP